MYKYSKAELADAKQEYTRGLTDLLTEPIYKGLKSIYNRARTLSKSNNLNTLKTFQLLLSKTPKWSDDKISKEISQIKGVADCDYLEDLVTAVFVTHAKILISIKSKSKTDTIDLNVPKINYFIHTVYIQCARNFWRQPWLFHTGYNSLDLQRNLIKAENLIKESILETIRKLLPIKEVLQQYLGNNFIDQDFTDYTDDDITSTISEKTKTNIRKLLKHELDNNLKTVSETTDFSKVVISGNPTSGLTSDNLIPENFDNRTVDDTSVVENNDMSNTKLDTETPYEEDQTNKQDTETQYEEVVDNIDADADEDKVKMSKSNPDVQLINKTDEVESDTDTVIENISVFDDTDTVKTNLVDNFSFFEDAADF